MRSAAKYSRSPREKSRAGSALCCTRETVSRDTRSGFSTSWRKYPVKSKIARGKNSSEKLMTRFIHVPCIRAHYVGSTSGATFHLYCHRPRFLCDAATRNEIEINRGSTYLGVPSSTSMYRSTRSRYYSSTRRILIAKRT